jgi:hypothetical protein
MGICRHQVARVWAAAQAAAISRELVQAPARGPVVDRDPVSAHVPVRDLVAAQQIVICKTSSTFPAVVVGMPVVVGHRLVRQALAVAEV